MLKSKIQTGYISELEKVIFLHMIANSPKLMI